MKVTAQEEYGLRCILHLARREIGNPAPAHEEAEAVTVAEIADREGLSVQYAGKLIRILGKAGLVEGVRGCKGGYRLARPPGTIPVAQVLAALGGRVYEPRVCERYTGDRASCVHTGDCSVRSLWSGLQLMIDAVLTRTTLRDLTENERSVAGWMHANVSALLGFLEEHAAETILRADEEDAATNAVRPLGRQDHIPIVRQRPEEEPAVPGAASSRSPSSPRAPSHIPSR